MGKLTSISFGLHRCLMGSMYGGGRLKGFPWNHPLTDNRHLLLQITSDTYQQDS